MGTRRGAAAPGTTGPPLARGRDDPGRTLLPAPRRMSTAPSCSGSDLPSEHDRQGEAPTVGNQKPAEGTRSVINVQGEGTVAMRGEGRMVWVSGGCREPILDGMEPGQVQNLVFRCNGCGACNETLD